MSFDDFLVKLDLLDIDGVSLESCFIPQFTPAFLNNIKTHLDLLGIDRVYAWGHPDGLEGGTNDEAFDQLLKHISYAEQIGAPVMRVVGSSLKYRFGDHAAQLEKLSHLFAEATRVAVKHGVKLAVENHIDYDSDEILSLVTNVNSPNFGVNFDSGNFLRVGDDPVLAMKKLAPFVLATHIKDLKPVMNVPENEWYHFSCVPTGRGVVDNNHLARLLYDRGYKGFLAVEIDFLHPDYQNQEEQVVNESLLELRRITKLLE